jgi:peptidyl-tRNA hydrolase, PTH2 family
MIMNSNVKQIIIVRKDLNMRKGKLAAQCCHASMKVILDMMFNEYSDEYCWKRLFIEYDSPLNNWINGIFTKIVVGCDSLDELNQAYESAKNANLPCSIIEDAGLTEFNSVPTITCVAIGPALGDEIDKITGNFKLI